MESLICSKCKSQIRPGDLYAVDKKKQKLYCKKCLKEQMKAEVMKDLKVKVYV